MARPELDLAIRDADQLGQDIDRLLGRRGSAEDPEPRYVLTQRGRDYLAHQRALADLFGPWPTRAELDRLDAVA